MLPHDFCSHIIRLFQFFWSLFGPFKYLIYLVHLCYSVAYSVMFCNANVLRFKVSESAIMFRSIYIIYSEF